MKKQRKLGVVADPNGNREWYPEVRSMITDIACVARTSTTAPLYLSGGGNAEATGVDAVTVAIICPFIPGRRLQDVDGRKDGESKSSSCARFADRSIVILERIGLGLS